MSYYVYILASRKNGTLYVGSTTNLVKRVYEHKNKFLEGFSSKYSVTDLVYFEEFGDIYEMARRERRIKEWKRAWKVRIIEQQNPNWQDLYEVIC
jgi:putative endonuclease